MISDWWQYEALPVGVLDDCRLLMEAEAVKAQKATAKSAR